MDISVLHINLPHYSLDPGCMIDSGAYGRIYEKTFKEKSYVAKFLPFVRKKENQEEEELERQIWFFLREVFITKIASQLGVGPKFYGFFSYDLIIFKDGAQFVLEKCETEINSIQ